MPELKITENLRKYEKYSKDKREAVVCDYLFNGNSHRWLDEHILERDSTYTRGWDSMAILHHLGLIDSHKGIFKGMTMKQAIQELEAQQDEHFEAIIRIIRSRVITYSLDVRSDDVVGEHIKGYAPSTLDEVNTELEQEVQHSRKLRKQDRERKLQGAAKIPKLLTVTTNVYQRNADVVVAVLERANGVCERCRANAPFVRASDGTPYLEVHHKMRLADGGEDSVENTIAVCPNCHRKLHFGRVKE